MVGKQEIVDDVNKWRNIRGALPPAFTLKDVNTTYRKKDFTVQTLVANPANIGALINIVPAPYAAPPQTANELKFLASSKTGVPGLKRDWTGKSVLHNTGSMVVSHYEYTPPGAPTLEPTTGLSDIVVKEFIKDPDDALLVEYDNIERLRQTGSQHILRSPCGPKMFGSKGPNAGLMKRMFTEFCPNKDLWEQILIRRATPQPFNVLTVWKIFECLIDGACAMQYGKELVNDGSTANVNTFTVPPEDEWWTEIIYGDFGQSERVTQKKNNSRDQADLDWKEVKRGDVGTEKYYPPELFHADWESKNWYESSIAGNFNGETYSQFNIGQVMWQVVTLSIDPPDIKNPFLPSWQINGKAPGITYGVDLNAYVNQYSKSLTDLIFECLYQDPMKRVSLADLKRRVTQGFAFALNAGERLEDWANFLPAPPVGPVAGPAPAPAAVVVPAAVPAVVLAVVPAVVPAVAAGGVAPAQVTMRCAGMLPRGQCRNTFRGVPIINPRCKACINAGR